MIEILYFIPLIVLIIVAFAFWIEKIDWVIGIISIALAFIVAWLLQAYTAVVMTPLGNALWYGYSWGIVEILGLVHLILIFLCTFRAVYNLWVSKGKVIWP